MLTILQLYSGTKKKLITHVSWGTYTRKRQNIQIILMKVINPKYLESIAIKNIYKIYLEVIKKPSSQITLHVLTMHVKSHY